MTAVAQAGFGDTFFLDATDDEVAGEGGGGGGGGGGASAGRMRDGSGGIDGGVGGDDELLLGDEYALGDEATFKLVVLGEGSVGKTSVIRRYAHGSFSASYRNTIGVDFALKELFVARRVGGPPRSSPVSPTGGAAAVPAEEGEERRRSGGGGGGGGEAAGAGAGGVLLRESLEQAQRAAEEQGAVGAVSSAEDETAVPVKVETSRVRLQLWDVAGQERFGALTHVYFRETSAAALVFDVMELRTFDAILKWKTDLDAKARLPDGSRVPCILLANKCDLLPKEQPKEKGPSSGRRRGADADARDADGGDGNGDVEEEEAEGKAVVDERSAWVDSTSGGPQVDAALRSRVPAELRKTLDSFVAQHEFLAWFATSAKDNVGVDGAFARLAEHLIVNQAQLRWPVDHTSFRLANTRTGAGMAVTGVPGAPPDQPAQADCPC